MTSSDNKNYYDVLEVTTNATHQDIQTAYKRAKNAYTGDSAALYSLMTQDECEKVVDQIEEAISILGTPEKRREYDKARGINQHNLPQGYTEELNSKPDYKPSNSLSDMISETNNESQTATAQDKEDFKFDESTVSNESKVSKIQAVQKFGLDFNPSTQMEQKIENYTEYTGEVLKEIREYKNVSIERMADMTKISKTYIKNIEGDAAEKLPADVFTRGFVYQYAKCLKLNPELVAGSYLQHIRQLKLNTATAQ